MENTKQISQSDFWNLQEVKDQQEIQKRNPYGSDAHRKAESTMKAICASRMGDDFANDYFGDY